VTGYATRYFPSNKNEQIINFNGFTDFFAFHLKFAQNRYIEIYPFTGNTWNHPDNNGNHHTHEL